MCSSDLSSMILSAWMAFSSTLTIREIMNPNPIRVNVDEKAIQALKIMEEREKPLAVLPVVDSDSIVRGMIHLHDLIDKGL